MNEWLHVNLLEEKPVIFKITNYILHTNFLLTWANTTDWYNNTNVQSKHSTLLFKIVSVSLWLSGYVKRCRNIWLLLWCIYTKRYGETCCVVARASHFMPFKFISSFLIAYKRLCRKTGILPCTLADGNLIYLCVPAFTSFTINTESIYRCCRTNKHVKHCRYFISSCTRYYI